VERYRLGSAAAGDPFSAWWYLALVFLALEGG
jgi:hypothetical protein